MSFSATLTKTYDGPGGQVPFSETFTQNAAINLDESIATGQTAYLINIAIDVSEIECIYIVSDKAVELKTNATGGGANDTINLLANKPLIWEANSYYACPLGTDVTKIYIANSSGATATLRIRGLQDPTP